MSTPDEKIGLEQILYQTQQEMLEEAANVRPTMAIDINCLIDYDVTNLLTMCDGENYRELFKHLGEYNESYRADRFETLATSVGISPTRCRELDPKRYEFDYFVQTKDTVKRIVDEALDMQSKSVEVAITVYTGGRYVPAPIQGMFAAMFSNMNVTVKYSPDDLYKLTEEQYGQFGMIVVYDFHKLFENLAFSKAFGKAELLATRILTHRIIKEYNDEVPETTLLRNVELPMSDLFDDFEYITMRLVNLGRW